MQRLGQRAWILGLLLISACEGKMNTKEVGGSSEVHATAQSAEAKAEGPAADPVATTKLETASNDILLGAWQSQCISDPNSSLRPGLIIQYQFQADGSAQLKTLSYRDLNCNARYTKADVDKLRTQFQAQAAAAGAPPLTENELKQYDALWIPPLFPLQFKLGRKYTSGLIEIDTVSKASNGVEQTIYSSLYFDAGLLYFAETCFESDAQFGSCSPIAGDRADRRGKKIDYAVGYEKQAAAPVPSTP